VKLLNEKEVGEIYDHGKEVMVAAYMRLQNQIVQLMERVSLLEARLNQNSQNSSKPPSSDGYRKPSPKSLRKKSGRGMGGQPGHEGKTLERVMDPDHIVHHWPERCACCGEHLSQEYASGCESRQVHDVPPVQIEVTDHRAMQVICGACGQSTQGSFPAQVDFPVQYGSGVKALGVYAMMYQLIPVERSGELMSDLFGRAPSCGTLVNWVNACAERVAPIVALIKLAIHGSPVVHFDETGLRVAVKLHWLHSASTATLTYYAIDTKRAGVAFDRVGILPEFKGVGVHDALPSYLKRDIEHALCNAHLLRELTALEEETRQRWPTQLKTVMIDMKARVEQAVDRGADHLRSDVQARLELEYDRLVKRALSSNPRPKYPPGQKGRPRASPARNLAERLLKHKDSVLRFMRDFRVPFDNNQAERDLRMMKVRQKISGCFRSLEGAQAFAKIRSYVSTARKQGYGALDALRSLFDGSPVKLVLG
jgi:transposase